MTRPNALPSKTRQAFCLLCVGLALFMGQPAFTDDTDLLRTNTAQPYVLVILDTSDSMNLTLGTTEWHPLNGDNPGYADSDPNDGVDDSRDGSKLYEAKKALYETFVGVNDVNFGFMTFNQNELRAESKHWLYGLAQNIESPWPLLYPVRDVNGIVDPTDDVFTLGRHLADPSDTNVPPARLSVAGSCENPLDLSDDIDRAKINRFPKLGETGDQTTTIWVSHPAPITVDAGTYVYRLEISAPSIDPIAGTPALGDPMLDLELTVTRVKNCIPDDAFSSITKTLSFVYLGEFLIADAGDRFDDSGAKKDEEASAGFWGSSDAQSESVCSEKSPFSGKGLESNYDDPLFTPSPPDADLSPTEEGLLSSEDEHCVGNGADQVCRNLKFPTQIDAVFPEFRELDRGDFIPYHWSIPAKNDFLKRLNPNHGSTDPPDFGVAGYFADAATSGSLPLKNANRKPILATGATPFGKAVNDYRCWYIGPEIGPSGKCRDKAGDKLAFGTGWQQVADGRDPDYACRQPYVILISDGEDTCPGENVSADINDFDAFGVRTWILNVSGDPDAFNNLENNAGAEVIDVTEGQQLKDELEEILGIISSDTRAFASAAVPSVQTEIDDKILLTSFNPLDGEAVWAGDALAFLKPLPTKEEPVGSGRFVPDLSKVCNATTITRECFLWDAGEVIKTQVNLADPVGSADTQRRVYHPQVPSVDGVPLVRADLEGRVANGLSITGEKDLWRGLGIAFTEGDEPSEEAARIEAKRILDLTYSIKTGLLDLNDPDSDIQYLLGDTFHADPVVIGGPASNRLFAQNFEDYRDFATKHRFRRKMLATAANDGMLHFFDAGVADIVSDQVQFTNGTGKEIAAFVPRSIMPKLKPLVDGNSHLWSVDGALAIADAYFDPEHTGTPDPDQREWRTVVIAGLRRGGEIVYALDITQPDELEEITLPGPPTQTVVVPKNPGTVPDCHEPPAPGATATDFGCHHKLPFPAVLWEFDDTVEIAGTKYRLDEDLNGEFDLAFTWSKPNLGRIQVKEGATIVDKFVAVFAGGLDPDRPTTRGDWLYIVDIETGNTIYKERLLLPGGLSGGAAPSEPAAVDTNQDGLLDRVYIATTGGYVYRLDLGPDSSGNLPELTSHNLMVDTGVVPLDVVPVSRISGRTPRVIFDNINSATGKRLPFFFRPSVIFTPHLAPNFGLALGDGDRENLWSLGQSPGRFYVFADDTDPTDPTDIITAALLETAPAGLATTDFLFTPVGANRHGWFLNLAANERVVSDAFALSGITVFTTYTPDDNSTVPGNNGGGNNNEPDPRLCSRTGKSKVFAVLTTNGNGVLFDTNDVRTRSTGVDTLVGKAFADLTGTQNPPPSGGTLPVPDPLPPNRQLILDELKKLFPSNCRFANYTIDIRAIASDTEIVEVAPVPVCIIEKNWREF